MKLKNWILKKKITLFVMIIGAIAGFSYWYFIGCSTGNCGITSNWRTSTAYGVLMGWFVGDFAREKMDKPKQDK